jgi:hypothetical protein
VCRVSPRAAVRFPLLNSPGRCRQASAGGSEERAARDA